MRRYVTAAIFGLLLAGFGVAQAQEFKVGFVFLEEIRARAEPYQEASRQFNQMVSEREQESQRREAEIQRMQESLERRGSLMTERTRAEQTAQIRQKVQEFQQWASGAQGELQQQHARMIQPIDAQVLEVIQQVAQELGYDMVLDGTAIAYLRDHEEHNLTQAVIDAVNEE